MKNLLVIALVVLGATQVMAAPNTFSYACLPSDATGAPNDVRSALVQVIQNSVTLYAQGYQTAGHANFEAQGTLSIGASTSTRLVYTNLTDWSGVPVSPYSAQTVIVNLSEGTVTSIVVERFGAPLVYNKSCQVDDGSK